MGDGTRRGAATKTRTRVWPRTISGGSGQDRVRVATEVESKVVPDWLRAGVVSTAERPRPEIPVTARADTKLEHPRKRPPSTAEFSGVSWLGNWPEPLIGCWYLDQHWNFDESDRTPTGHLVFRAKPYEGKPGERDAAHGLGSVMARGARVVSGKQPFRLDEAEVVLSVPAFPEKVPYNLPDILGDEVAEALGLDFVRRGLEKTKKTVSAKSSSPRQIRESNRNAYQVNVDVRGRTVLVVDDLVSTGTTLSVIAELLRDAGAAKVGAFAATRVLKGMQA